MFKTVIVYVISLPASMGQAALVFVTVTSALWVMALAADAVLVLVVEVTVAVLVIVVKFGVLGNTRTTTVKVAESPRARVAIVSLIVPVPPTAGPVRVKGRPEVCVSETNVVSAGRASVNATVWASLGPVFKTVIVYVILLPASMGPAARSSSPSRLPFWVMALAADAVLVLVVEVTVAVLVIVVKFGVLGNTRRTTVKVAESPKGRVAIVSLIVPVPPTAGPVREGQTRSLRVRDKRGIGRQGVSQRHGLGVAGARVQDRDRVRDIVAREYGAGRAGFVTVTSASG